MKEQAIVKVCRLFLFDMDGTLYLGNQLFSFTKPLLAAIRRRGGRYLFMTNNSSKSVMDYVKKLATLGIDATEEDFVTSAQATIWHLKRHHPSARLYVCGTASFKAELCAAGFDVTEDWEEADCLLMGFDTELTFQKLEDACRLLLRGVPYIATNPDLVCPTEFGSVPDCGSVCRMLETATGRTPLVIGKPEPLMPQLAMEWMSCTPDETVVIGDRIYTDIKCGLAAGTHSILVLSGETDERILAESPEKPELVLADCGELLRILEERE